MAEELGAAATVLIASWLLLPAAAAEVMTGAIGAAGFSGTGTAVTVTADLSAYKGQTITLWFNVHLDGASPADDTWMYLDEATLTTS